MTVIEKETVWKGKPDKNYRWIVIIYKDGTSDKFNADYIDRVEYIENDETGIPE